MNDELGRGATDRPYRVANLPPANYRSDPSLSRGAILDLLRSPAHYYARHLAADLAVEEPSDAMRLGTLVHLAILEPSAFKSTVAEGPDVSRATRIWKEAEAAAGGCELLKPAEMRKIVGIRDAVLAHPIARSIFGGPGLPEASYFWPRQITGRTAQGDGSLWLRARPDFVTDDGFVVDLKTTTDARAETFTRRAWDLGYHVQAALYLEGVSRYNVEAGLPAPRAFVIVAVETDPPFAVQVFAPDDGLLHLGAQAIDVALSRFVECSAAGDWPSYSREIVPLSPPRWAGSGF